MSEGLDDFFKLIAEDKKKKKEEFNEMVGDLGLDSLFKDIAVEKKRIKEEKKKEVSKKIEEQKKQKEKFDKIVGDISLDSLFDDLAKVKKESKEEKEKEQKILSSFENFLTNKIDDIEEIKDEVVEDINVVEEVKPEPEVSTFVEKSVKTLEEVSDPLTPLDQNFATLQDLQDHYRKFLVRIQQQLSSLGGGGIEDAPKSGGPYVRQNQAWADLGSLDILKGTTGYEFTGAFVERTTGQSGANDIGTDYEYPQSLAESQTWKRFGFSVAQQVANDVEYWGETNPNFDQTKGVFGGLYMPNGFSNMIDYSDTSVGAAVTTGNLKYTAANGSYDFSDGHPGMFAQIRFSYNITPLVAGTTVETALIWHTRNENDDVTFSFTLTNQPITYDSNSVGRTLLSRVEITAYFASDEDVNARALPAIRSDNRCIIQPLTTLVTLSM